MYSAQAYVRERHASHVLCHSHSVASLRVRRLVNGCLKVACDHLDSLNLEHVAHLPSALCDEALDGVSECVETGSCGERARQRVHEFCVYDGDSGDVVRIDAYHLLLVLLVGDYVVDGHFGCCASCCRQSDDWHRLVLGVGNAFERNHVCELRVVGDDADGLRCVDARTAADGEQEVGTRLGECFQTELHVLNGRVLLYLAEHLVWYLCLVEHVEHFLCNTKLNKVFIGANKCFVQTETAYFAR